MKYAVTFNYDGIEQNHVNFFDSLQSAIDYVKAFSLSVESANIYEVRTQITCKFIDNKLIIS